MPPVSLGLIKRSNVSFYVSLNFVSAFSKIPGLFLFITSRDTLIAETVLREDFGTSGNGEIHQLAQKKRVILEGNSQKREISYRYNMKRFVRL